MRRTSVSLPTNKIAHDPHEKPARYGAQHRQGGIWGKVTAWMAAAKQTRWIKTAAILVAIFFLVYYFSPSGVDLYHEGEMRRPAVRLSRRRSTVADDMVMFSVLEYWRTDAFGFLVWYR